MSVGYFLGFIFYFGARKTQLYLGLLSLIFCLNEFVVNINIISFSSELSVHLGDVWIAESDSLQFLANARDSESYKRYDRHFKNAWCK